MHDISNAILDNPVWKFMRNPFKIDVVLLSDPLQEQDVGLKCDSNAKDNFETMSLVEFWAKYLPINPYVGE